MSQESKKDLFNCAKNGVPVHKNEDPCLHYTPD